MYLIFNRYNPTQLQDAPPSTKVPYYVPHSDADPYPPIPPVSQSTVPPTGLSIVTSTTTSYSPTPSSPSTPPPIPPTSNSYQFTPHHSPPPKITAPNNIVVSANRSQKSSGPALPPKLIAPLSEKSASRSGKGNVSASLPNPLPNPVKVVSNFRYPSAKDEWKPYSEKDISNSKSTSVVEKQLESEEDRILKSLLQVSLFCSM